MEDGPPFFKQGFSCPALLMNIYEPLPVPDYHCLRCIFPYTSGSFIIRYWASPRSLATTNGVSFDFLSFGYLDVSVPRVRFINPMYSVNDTVKNGGLPHSDTCGSKTALVSPQLFAECHVLLRLLVPRHPLNALNYLNSSNA